MNYFTFAQVSSLNKLMTNFLYPNCQQANLSLKIDGAHSYGFASKASVACGTFMKSVAEEFLFERVVSSRETRGRAPFEINLRVAITFRGIGCGQSALTEWGPIISMPSFLAKITFHSLQETVC